jgi:hypothetical protein
VRKCDSQLPDSGDLALDSHRRPQKKVDSEVSNTLLLLLLLLQVGLLGPDGQDLPLHLEGKGAVGTSTVLRCDADTNTFTFTDVQVRGGGLGNVCVCVGGGGMLTPTYPQLLMYRCAG